MNAKGNKLSSCKIPDQYLKKTFRTLVTSAKKEEKENSEYKSVVIQS